MRHFLCVHHLSDRYALFTKIPIPGDEKQRLTPRRRTYRLFCDNACDSRDDSITTPTALAARTPFATQLTLRFGLERKRNERDGF